jgi:hypothetical protein
MLVITTWGVCGARRFLGKRKRTAYTYVADPSVPRKRHKVPKEFWRFAYLLINSTISFVSNLSTAKYKS